MSNQCNCPLCRFARKELTASEIGWYLKGTIEEAHRYIKMIQDATSLDELKEFTSMDEHDLDCSRDMLFELKDNATRNPDHWWDPAMDQPDVYATIKDI